MRKTLVLFFSSLFFYALFGHMTVVRTLMLFGGVASAYAVSRIPSRFIRHAKYPLIGLSLALSPLLFLYPALKTNRFLAPMVVFLTFYSIALFLVTLEEKERRIYKEVIGLSLLYAASSVNLFLTGRAELICPLSISVLLFLFIVNKSRMMPFIAGYAAVAVAFLCIRGVSVFSGGPSFDGVERYLLLGCSFALLLIAFVTFIKRPDFAAIFAFFGLLYVSIDLLMSVGFRVKSILVYQPVMALLVVGPLMGMALKGEKERL